MKGLYQLERKFGRFAIPNLMMAIVVGMFGVFLVDLFFPQFQLSSWISLDRALILQGQVWRLITFIFLPPSTSIVWILFSLYFYYLIGSALEQQWGAFRFNLYYQIGMLGTIIGAMITGHAVNTYLNLSLFFAFAVLFPDFQVMLFFVLPVKIKYLAFADALLFLIAFISGGLSTKVAILFSLLNFFLFFGGDFFQNLKQNREYRKNQKNFRDYYNRW